MKQLTLRIPVDIHKKTKIQAAREGISMVAFFLRAVKKELKTCQDEQNPGQSNLPS